MASREQIKAHKEALKTRIKDNKRLRTWFLAAIRISLKPDMFKDFITQAYDIFQIDYKIEKMFIEMPVGSWHFKKQYIGYFTLWGDIAENKIKMIDLYVTVLEGILKARCIEKNYNPSVLFNSMFFSKEFRWWLKNFSTVIVEEIAKLMTSYHNSINFYYAECFEMRNNKLILKPDTDYLTNENKSKLFKEYKFSTAENYYGTELANWVKESFREQIIDKYTEFFEEELEKLDAKVEEMNTMLQNIA